MFRFNAGARKEIAWVFIRAAIPVAAVLAGSSVASADQYCAKYYDGQQSCGIPTYQSCLQSISGVGGECVVDDSFEIPKNLMQRLIEAQQPPPAVRDLEPVPPPPQR